MPSINKRQVRREIIRQMIINECACQDNDMSWDDGGQGKTFDHNGPEAESNMIRSNLYTMSQKARQMHDMIGTHDDLPEWVQEKIAVASSMIDGVSDYLGYEYGDQGVGREVMSDDMMDDDSYEEFEVPHDDMGMDDEMDDMDMDDMEADEEHFDLLDERDEDEDMSWKPLRQSTGIMFFEDDEE